MSGHPAELAIERHDARGLHEQKDDVLAVFHEAYAELLSETFFCPNRFWQRLESYASRDGFQLVTGRLDGELVGFTLGETLPAGTGWWRNFTATLTLICCGKPAAGRSSLMS